MLPTNGDVGPVPWISAIVLTPTSVGGVVTAEPGDGAPAVKSTLLFHVFVGGLRVQPTWNCSA